ncbi:hypothetical protein CsatA_027831 [Cannabis sativa]
MQKKKSNLFQPLVIFFRLFSFIMDSLIPRGLKRVVTTSQSMHHQASTVVPMVSSKPNMKRVELQPQAHYINHSDDFGSSWAEATRPKIQKSAQIYEHSEDEDESNNYELFVDSKINFEEEERKRIRKGKSVTVELEKPEDVKLPNCPPRQRQRQVRPLFDVAVNINEKSDAFIRSRKEAMRRNFT